MMETALTVIFADIEVSFEVSERAIAPTLLERLAGRGTGPYTNNTCHCDLVYNSIVSQRPLASPLMQE